MPTRKQRRREAKTKRHEYEFVYVDADGNELDESPEPEAPKEREVRRNGVKPAASSSRTPQKGTTQQGKQTRARKAPLPPSWQRASKRAGLLGIVVFVLFGFSSSKSHNGWAAAAIQAVIYTLLFIPFTFAIDRFAYKRYLAREAGGGPPARPTKKR